MRSSLLYCLFLTLLCGFAGCQEAGPPTVEGELTPQQEKQQEDQLKAAREKEAKSERVP
jgi:hypothetical protein